MEDLIETVTRGNPTEVKVLLASVALALAVYQLVLISVGYGKVRPRFLAPRVASSAHRAVGDTIAVLLVVTAVMCVGYFGFEAERSDAHVPVALALLGVLAFKIAVVRWIPRLGFLLPLLGVSVLLLFVATWLTVAPPLLG